MSENIGHHAFLSIDHPSELELVAHALSSPARLEVLRLLSRNSLVSVSDIAKTLNMPLSTASMAVSMLEGANLIATETRPGSHGLIKLCWIRTTQIHIVLSPQRNVDGKCIILKMPIGGYSSAESIRPTCGLLSEYGELGLKDSPALFYSTERFSAQLLWFHSGFLEYRFSAPGLDPETIDWLELSFEACSEAPMYKSPWESDISVLINQRPLGIWTSPCDCGGRHGAITPEWWADSNTQFGFMKTWHIDRQGTYLDQNIIGRVTLRDLGLQQDQFIAVRIGISPDAVHVGGLNLFGEKFGDYAQGLTMRIGLQ